MVITLARQDLGGGGVINGMCNLLQPPKLLGRRWCPTKVRKIYEGGRSNLRSLIATRPGLRSGTIALALVMMSPGSVSRRWTDRGLPVSREPRSLSLGVSTWRTGWLLSCYRNRLEDLTASSHKPAPPWVFRQNSGRTNIHQEELTLRRSCLDIKRRLGKCSSCQ